MLDFRNDTPQKLNFKKKFDCMSVASCNMIADTDGNLGLVVVQCESDD